MVAGIISLLKAQRELTNYREVYKGEVYKKGIYKPVKEVNPAELP